MSDPRYDISAAVEHSRETLAKLSELTSEVHELSKHMAVLNERLRDYDKLRERLDALERSETKMYAVFSVIATIAGGGAAVLWEWFTGQR